MDCRKKTKEACKASTKCTYATGKKRNYCKKKNTIKSLCRKKNETKCKRVRGCKFASGTKRKFCRKNVTKRRKKIVKGGAPVYPIQDKVDEIKTHLKAIDDLGEAHENMFHEVFERVDNISDDLTSLRTLTEDAIENNTTDIQDISTRLENIENHANA